MQCEFHTGKKLSLQESNQLIGIKMPTSGFPEMFGSQSKFSGRGKCPFCIPCPADAHATIDYFISGSINKATSSNETKKRF